MLRSSNRLFLSKLQFTHRAISTSAFDTAILIFRYSDNVKQCLQCQSKSAWFKMLEIIVENRVAALAVQMFVSV